MTETTTTETTVEVPAPELVPDGPSTRVEVPDREVTTETTTTETVPPPPDPPPYDPGPGVAPAPDADPPPTRDPGPIPAVPEPATDNLVEPIHRDVSRIKSEIGERIEEASDAVEP